MSFCMTWLWWHLTCGSPSAKIGFQILICELGLQWSIVGILKWLRFFYRDLQNPEVNIYYYKAIPSGSRNPEPPPDTNHNLVRSLGGQGGSYREMLHTFTNSLYSRNYWNSDAAFCVFSFWQGLRLWSHGNERRHGNEQTNQREHGRAEPECSRKCLGTRRQNYAKPWRKFFQDCFDHNSPPSPIWKKLSSRPCILLYYYTTMPLYLNPKP